MELVAIFTPDGIELDYAETDKKNPEKAQALYDSYMAGGGLAAILPLGFGPGNPNFSVSLSYLAAIARRFVRAVSRDPALEVGGKAGPPSDEDILALLHILPYVHGIEHISFKWLKDFWNGLADAFNGEVSRSGGSAADYLRAMDERLPVAGRVVFHLVESREDEWPFAFLATYCKEKEHLPLKNALKEFAGRDELLLPLLGAVTKAADSSALVSELVESGEIFSPLRFRSEEAHVFLKEIPLYEECGIQCRMPDWWGAPGNKFRACASVGSKPPARMGLDAVLSFDPAIYLGDDEITREELDELLASAQGLAFIKGKWVDVDHGKLRSVLDAYSAAEKLAGGGGLTLREALRMQLGIGAAARQGGGEKAPEVANGEWLAQLLEKMGQPEKIREIDPGSGFKARLRPYQLRGASWLAYMRSLGFGALLADDMGLGKTVQILALLEHMRGCGDFRALLVVPASLLGNWKREIGKFAPGLEYRILHGAAAKHGEAPHGLTITTYGMAARLEWLSQVKWDAAILDEAQAIKNPATKQCRAIKQIPAAHRIAMTGTPVENRLGDLWSIFDFANPGLLGTRKEFVDFTKEEAEKADGAGGLGRLRQITSPFILRRLKTDKSVIADLPDKIEVKALAGLTKRQAALYGSLVKSLADSLFHPGGPDGIRYKGMVLAALTKFKQICNHPSQYLGQGVFEPGHSGKFGLLAEICETIREKRERALVFTQFREMTKPLDDFLAGIFGKKGLALHGGTPVKKRQEIVDKFNGPAHTPYMVLSLKAGGVGLNLTAANHVIHFDRWWNPAIESQATDRAFRIGQTRNVLVHKFVTEGTIEEKIDRMLDEKQKLANEIVAGSGESWLAEMSGDELMALFAL